MKKTKPPKMETCWHEAGHAVIAFALDIHIESVSAVAKPYAYGVCKHLNPLFLEPRYRRANARACIVMAYAGIEAAKLHEPNADESTSAQDFRDAFEMSRDFVVLPRSCTYIGDDAHDAFLLKLRGEARHLVKRHRHQIERLALLLMDRHTLTGIEARKAIDLA